MLERDRESTVVFVEGARDAYLGYVTIKVSYCKVSRVMKKTYFCLCENKDVDQHRNCEADKGLCFRYSSYSTIPLLPISVISEFSSF